MDISRRIILAASTAVLTVFSTHATLAQTKWPERPVRVISPYGAGGSNDISARILSEHIGKRLRVQFLVENKPGAATRLANETVARAAPDGSSFLYAAAPYATVESLYGKLSYDPRKDLIPVTLAVAAPLFLVVNANLPVHNVREFIAFAKTKSEGVTFACTGVGSAPHLATELFFRESGIKGLNVQFRGDATAYTELLAGRVDATLTALTTALPHIQAGKLRVLAVASEERSPLYPAAPTLVEQGVDRVFAYGWFGFMAPAGTQPAVIDKLSAEVSLALKDPAVRQHLVSQGLQPMGGTPAQFGSFIERETRKWSEIIKAADIKPE